MKIAIAKGVSTLLVASSTPGIVFDDTGHALKSLQAGQAVYAKPAGHSIDLNSWQAPPSVWIRPAQGGYVHVGEHWYRGTIRLIFQGNVLLAVNHVNLEDYLSSVVGSEMWSNWPLEALKAQAVAARSYALARYVQPASRFYQMGADEAWQAYKGLDGEASSTHQAVRETSGQILSYKGGVVDSLYAATDDIVLKAHGGRGMSQEGAHTLALQGYDYLHILGAYYPGTNLARVQLSEELTRQ
jgi:peptidoglycan hydrolase-like amidase